MSQSNHTGSNAGTTDQDSFQTPTPQFDTIQLPDGERELMLHVPRVEGVFYASDTYIDDVRVIR